MSVDVSPIKVKFAHLKWEQLLADKYLVESCFSKKWESLTAKEQLQALDLKIKALHCSTGTYQDGLCGPDCE